jgi:hypothetical protein
VGQEKFIQGSQMDKIPYLVKDYDRHGNLRYYYRRGGRKFRIHGEPGTHKFQVQIDRAKQLIDYQGSFVYFAKVANGNRLKIGLSRDPRTRVKILSIGSPVKLVLYYARPGDRQMETRLHRRFAADRLHGEWFRVSEDILHWIDMDAQERRHIHPPRQKSKRSQGSILSPEDQPSVRPAGLTSSGQLF